MKKFYTLAIAAMAVIGLALFAKPALAVHAGTGQGLTCGSCHTMHSSQGGTSVSAMGGEFGSTLLLRVPITAKYLIGNFCLSCHAENGVQAGTQQNSGVWLTTPPKVYRITAWTNGDFTEVGAGGDFSGSGDFDGTTFTNTATEDDVVGLGRGHSINLQAADMMPPGSNSTTGGIESFTCTTCHDPHGTTATVAAINKYRNLRGNITDGGNGIAWTADIADSYVGSVGNSAEGGTGIGAANNTWPVFRTAASQNSYSGSATAGANFARFCAQCHGDWHEDTSTPGAAGEGNWAVAGSNPTSGNFDWKRHPVNAALIQTGSLLSTSGVSIVDKGHYDQTYGNLALGKKLPAAEVDISSGTETYYADEDADKVFCLSCHFAHGSPNLDILRWSYTSAVSAGSQTGNAIDTDTGCQQCHNRGGDWGN